MIKFLSAQVCMVDINGQKSLSAAGFQKEFPAENVFFAKVDISDAKQLVRLLKCKYTKQFDARSHLSTNTMHEYK